MHSFAGRMVEDCRGRVLNAERALQRVPDLIELATQRFGVVSGRLAAGLARNVTTHERDLVRIASRLSPLLLQRPQAVQRARLDGVASRLAPIMARRLERLSERLEGVSKLHASADPERPLRRGFARVIRADGSLVRAGAALESGEEVAIKFGDAVTRQAVIDGAGAANSRRPRHKTAPPGQGDLF